MDKWTICNKSGDFERIADENNLSQITARLLVNRDLTESSLIRGFMNPTMEDLHSPYLMKNLEKAVDIIVSAIDSNQKIRVVGDYDVDGIMSTYILDDALRLAGACGDWYIPHRIRDGYGLNEEIITNAYNDGVKLIITCDNGISAVAAAERAAEYGMQLIITDHHELPEVLPRATIIVDPKQSEDDYPCKDICGAVVAAKVAQVLFEKKQVSHDISGYLDLMAMATICDVVCLKGENHVIARLGMDKLKCTSNLGLRALMRETGVTVEGLNEYHIGFVLGPCFNATGRIDDAGLAIDLLKAADSVSAEKFALQCKALNEDRKALTAEQEKIAVSILDNTDSPLPKVIVIELKDCHESILGIIAGRLKERYNRPAIVVTQGRGGYKGSARSVPGYNMFEELKKCSEYLLKFGGHPMAAGLTVLPGMLEEFTAAMNEQCMLSDEDMQRKILIDAEVSFNLFSEQTLDEIGHLAPFGQGNPAPLFAERNLYVHSIRRMGKDGNFIKMRLINTFGHEFTAVSFLNAEELMEQLADKFGKNEVDRALNGGENRIVLTAAYVPRLNEYRESKEMQMNIKELRF